MKKLLFLLLLLIVISSITFASTGGFISATDVEAKTSVSGNHLLLVNDGANEVFVELKAENQSADQTATTSSFELRSGESITVDSDRGFEEISTICSAAETATVRFISWE